VCIICWERIYRVRSSGNRVEYEVYVESQLIKWLRVETSQADYLKAVTSEIWNITEQHKAQDSSNHSRNNKSKTPALKTKYSYHLGNFDKI
jgi:hypothetical protein